MRAPLRILFVLFSLMLTLRLTAQTQQTVTVWGLSVGPDSKGQYAVIREFERRFPQYKLRVLNMGAGSMNPQKLMTSIVGNVPPDVVNQDRFTISDWASRKAFQPLNELIERDKAKDKNCPTPDKYYESVWREASYGNHVYGIPTGADNRALYWNRTIFAKRATELRAAGLDPTRPPKTWSELLQYSKVLTEFNSDGSLKIAGFLPNYGNSWLYMFAFQNNAPFLSEDGKTCTLATDPVKESLKFMKAGYDLEGGYSLAQTFTSGFQGGENDPFIIGKVAMKIDGDWILNSLSRYGPTLDFGATVPPVPDDRFNQTGRFAAEKDKYITWVGGFSLAIPVGAKNRDGGWEFIKFSTSAEGRHIEYEAQREWERRKGRVFVPRLAALIAANDFLLHEFLPADDRLAAALKIHVDLMPYGRIRPATPVGQVLWDEHVRAIDNACLGALSIDAALLEGQQSVQREIDAVNSIDSKPVIDSQIPVYLSISIIGLALIGALVYHRTRRLGRLESSDARWAYLFVSPWVFGFAVFTVGPMVASFFFSFTQYNVLSPAHWAGMENYNVLFREDFDKILKAFGNVFYLGAVGVPLGLLTGLAVALLLNNAVRGMRFYRTAFYIPSIVPAVASAVLWTWLLTPDSNKGLINSAWRGTVGAAFGLQPPGWFTVPEWAKPGLVVMGLWGAGGGMLLWLAGLKGISTTLYEAASIDGATPARQLWSITLPQLSPIIFFNMIVGVIGAVQQFDTVYVIASGGTGPNDSLLTPVLHLFRNGFNYFKMGYASALAWIIFLIILALTGLQFIISKKWVHYESEK